MLAQTVFFFNLLFLNNYSFPRSWKNSAKRLSVPFAYLLVTHPYNIVQDPDQGVDMGAVHRICSDFTALHALIDVCIVLCNFILSRFVSPPPQSSCGVLPSLGRPLVLPVIVTHNPPSTFPSRGSPSRTGSVQGSVGSCSFLGAVELVSDHFHCFALALSKVRIQFQAPSPTLKQASLCVWMHPHFCSLFLLFFTLCPLLCLQFLSLYCIIFNTSLQIFLY